MDRYIHHVTLTTGHTRRSWRYEITPEAMYVVAGLLEQAVVEGEAAIPAAEPACNVSVTVEGQCMIATVWGPERAPLVTLGVAARARCGAKLWPMLHHHAALPLVTRTEERPDEPWCAVRLEPGIAIYTDAAHWLGDFERCIAWAWLARRDK